MLSARKARSRKRPEKPKFDPNKMLPKIKKTKGHFFKNAKFAQARKEGKARGGIAGTPKNLRKGVDRSVHNKRGRGQRTKGTGNGTTKAMLTRQPQPQAKKLLKAAAPRKKS